MKKSFEFCNPPQKKEALKSEHLKEGVRPILVCAGIPRQYRENPGAEEKILNSYNPELSGVHNVDYYGNPQELKELDFKNAGVCSYAISTVDGFDKFSKQYMNCTGVVVAGQSKETGENVSFLSHQDPKYFLDPRNNKRDKFSKDLTQRLDQLKQMCSEGTIDAVIIGGNYLKYDREHQAHYLKSIRLLSAKISEVLGFEPVIATGPKTQPGTDNVYYDNKERRLYIMRPSIGDATSKSYSPTDLKKLKGKWLKNV